MRPWTLARKGTMEFFIRHPLQTLMMILGGSAIAAATATLIHGRAGVASAFGALGTLMFTGAGTMMSRSGAWDGPAHEWGAVATDPRERLKFLLLALAMLGVGVAAMSLGFASWAQGQARIVACLLLVASGWLLLLLGVLCVVGWLQARRLFG